MTTRTETDAPRGDNDCDAPPAHAFRLGVDGEGWTHYASAIDSRVWLVDDDGGYDGVRELDGRSLVEWVAYVESEHGAWIDRQHIERPGGLGELAAQLTAKDSE